MKFEDIWFNFQKERNQIYAYQKGSVNKFEALSFYQNVAQNKKDKV